MNIASPFRLDGKVALITGSTRGIGLATAELMASAGAKLVISSRKTEACNEVAAKFQARGYEAIAVPAHVGNPDDLKRLVDGTMSAYGRIDVAVANAGVNPLFSTMQDYPEDTWDKVFETNTKSPWLLSKLVLPIIAQQGGGAMILLSSAASLVASPEGGVYAVAKAAANHLTRQLAAEWGPKGIRVNIVIPGTTRTDMIRAILSRPGAEEAIIERSAQRLGQPEDVGATILFLASPAGRQITGQMIVVDGGETLSARSSG